MLASVLKDPWARALLGAGLLAHLLMAFAFHLSPDETHYALYAVNPAWSYYDHPPLAGWLQWVFANWLGGGDVWMRILPMACWALAAWGVMALALTLFPQADSPRTRLQSTPFIALLLWLLSPLPHLVGLAMVPDTLLMPLICAVMLLCWRLCDAAQARRLGLWLGLGLALGLAGLSKYTAVLIGFGTVLALGLAHGPRLLALPGPWLALAVAGLCISPVIYWNATHGWISLAYQFGHATGKAEWRLGQVAGFVVVQLLGYGLLLVAGLVQAVRARTASATEGASKPSRRRSPLLSPLLFCTCFGLPTLLLLAYLSGRGSALPHWTVTAWVALTPAAAKGCQALWQRARGWVLTLGGVQALSFVALAGLMLAGGIGSETAGQATSRPGEPVAGFEFNPFTDLYGWDIAARRAKALAAQNGNPTLAVFNWTLDSRIAWYAKAPVKVVQRHLDQFGLWWGMLQPGENALVVDWSQLSFSPPVGPDEFERCEWVDQLPVMRLGRQVAHFNYLLCHHWQGSGKLPL